MPRLRETPTLVEALHPNVSESDPMTLRWLFVIAMMFTGALAFAAQQSASPATMLESAQAFLATLDAGQKTKAVLPFNSEERFHWFYTPVPRKGIPLKELNESQRKAALALLRSGLSEKG